MIDTPTQGSQGLGAIKSRYVNGVLVFYNPTTGAELFRIDPSVTGGYITPGVLRQVRQRFTLAQVNAGADLVAAVSGFKVRMVQAKIIAIGGNAATGTTVDILATQAASSVKLVAYAQASLTRSAVLAAGASGATVLADGASYAPNDAGTKITVNKTGSDFVTATAFDVIFDYVLEP